MRYLILFGLLAGCAVLPDGLKPKAQREAGVAQVEGAETAASGEQQRPVDGAVVAASNETPTTTQTVVRGALGVTVASLGSPAEPGLWLKTPLVKVQQPGKISYKGKTIDVTLIPIDGPTTAGSRMSLQAFQALGASLTDLPEIAVSA